MKRKGEFLRPFHDRQRLNASLNALEEMAREASFFFDVPKRPSPQAVIDKERGLC